MISLFLDRCALWFAAGTTALLLIGCVVLWLQRSPAHRQRTGELTILALLGWLLLAGLPLPRLLPEWHWPTTDIQPQTKRDVTTLAPPYVETAVVERDPSEELAAVAALVEAGEQWTIDSSTAAPRQIDSDELAADSIRQPAEDRPSPAALIAWMYCAGMLLCLLWLLGGALRLWWIMFTAHRPPAWLASLYESTGPSASKARLLITRYDIRPLSCGLTRSAILLPRKLVRRRKAELLRMILLHELAHVERRDCRGNALLCFALPLLYGHPLYWWLRRQYRMAAELLADAWAAQQAGTLPYVEQLISLAGALSPRAVPNSALAIFSSPSQFFRRMEMLMQRQVPLETSISMRWRLMSMVLLAAVVWMGAEIAGSRPVVGQDAPKSPPPTQPEVPHGAADKQNKPGVDKTPAQTPNLTEIELDDNVDLFVRDAEILVRKAPKANTDAVEAKLHAEIAAVERQLKELQAKLDALRGAKPVAVDIGAGKFTVQPTDSIIKLSRVGEDGTIIDEEWSVDRNGKPAKLISTKIQVQAQDSPIASSNTDVVVGEEYVIKEVTRKDGSVVRHVYDKNTGKFIETREGDAPAPKGGKRRAGEAPGRPEPKQQGGSSDRDGLGIDLVALATAYADAVSDLEAGQSTLARMADLVAKGVAPEKVVLEAQAAVDRAGRKQRTLHAILTVAAENARAKLDYLQRLKQKGYVSQEAVLEIETRCKMLDAILQSGPADARGAGSKSGPVEGESGAGKGSGTKF